MATQGNLSFFKKINTHIYSGRITKHKGMTASIAPFALVFASFAMGATSASGACLPSTTAGGAVTVPDGAQCADTLSATTYQIEPSASVVIQPTSVLGAGAGTTQNWELTNGANLTIERGATIAGSSSVVFSGSAGIATPYSSSITLRSSDVLNSLSALFPNGPSTPVPSTWVQMLMNHDLVMATLAINELIIDPAADPAYFKTSSSLTLDGVSNSNATPLTIGQYTSGTLPGIAGVSKLSLVNGSNVVFNAPYGMNYDLPGIYIPVAALIGDPANSGISIDATSTLKTLPQATYRQETTAPFDFVKESPIGTTLIGNLNNNGVLSLQNKVFEYFELTDKMPAALLGGVGFPAGYYGNYHGNGGTIIMEAQLGGDDSPHDELWIKGNVTGRTFVDVVNVNGAGAQTVNGIPLIYAGGTANPGAFVLARPVIAGAYEYNKLAYTKTPATLATGKGMDAVQSWNLVSQFIPSDPAPVDPPGTPSTPPTPQYQPMVPVAEALPMILQEYNRLPGYLDRRAGRSYQAPAPAAEVFCKDPSRGFRCQVTPEQNAYYAGAGGTSAFGIGRTGPWVKIEGGQSALSPSRSTTQFDSTTRYAGVSLGYDVNVWLPGGSLVAGVYGKYMNGHSDIKSPYGAGRVDTDGYAGGATLTYLSDSGFYLDGQFQYGRFSNDLAGYSTRFMSFARNVDATGWAAAAEVGKRFEIRPGFTIVPNVRLSYSSLNIDSFVDNFQAAIGFSDAGSLQLRGGVTLEGVIASSQHSSTAWYVGGGVSHEFRNDPTIRFTNLVLNPEQVGAWGDVQAGIKHSWADGAWSVNGDVRLASTFTDFTDSYSITGRVGLSFRW